MNSSRPKLSSFFFFKDVLPVLGLMIICLTVSSYFGGLTPRWIAQLSKNFKDKVSYFDQLFKLMFLFLGVYFNRVMYQLLVHYYIKKVIMNLRISCYSRWIHHDEGSKNSDQTFGLEHFPKGEFMARIMSDGEALRELVSSGVFGLVIDVFFLIFALLGLISMNQSAGLLLTVMILFSVLLLFWGSQIMRKVFLAVRDSRAAVSKELANVSGGFREMFFNIHEQYASKKCDKKFDHFLNVQLKQNFWDASYYSVAEGLFPLFLAFFVLVFPYTQMVSVAILLAFVDLILRSIEPIKGMASKMANIQRAYSGMIRVQDFLEKLNLVSSSKSNQMQKVIPVGSFQSFKVAIDLFQYPVSKQQQEEMEPFFLKDIVFEFFKGQSIGVVGISGSGKSTLMKLLAARLFSPSSRLDILMENQIISFPGNDQGAEYKRHIGLVSQDSYLFTAELFFNITFESHRTKKFDQFWTACLEFIPYLRQWDDKIDQIMRPSELSNGQRQLIAALRACYLKKTIILFDEISSSMDSDLELAIRAVIQLTQKNSLTFIVAHRLETLIQSDQILVLHSGELETQGSHQELILHSKIYQLFLNELRY